MVQAIFLGSVLVGVACLVGATAVARLNWRNDVAPFGRHTNMFELLVKPELYAVPAGARRTRILAIAGFASLAASALSLAYQFLMDFAR